jgi:hypothetical protein
MQHWDVSTRLTGLLYTHVKNNKPGIVGAEKVMIRLSRNDYEPDICFFQNEKRKPLLLTRPCFPHLILL